MGKSESHHSSDLTAFNDIGQGSESDYLFTGNSLLAVQNTVASNSTAYEFQENANSLQSLTLSMGSSGNNQQPSSTNCETSGDNTSTASGAASAAATAAATTAITPVVEATPRRTLDTFGQRTSIYRGVTRYMFSLRLINYME